MVTARQYARLPKTYRGNVPTLLPTPRQAAVLRFIGEHLARHQRPPTLREIGRVIGSPHPTAVLAHLTRLAAKGLIEFGDCDSAARSIRIVGLDLTAVVAARLSEVLGEDVTL